MMYVKYLTIISSQLLLPLLLLFLILREKMIRVGTLDSWGRERSGAIVLRQGTYLGQFTKNKVVKVFNTSWALSVICPSQLTNHCHIHLFIQSISIIESLLWAGYFKIMNMTGNGPTLRGLYSVGTLQ